MGRRGEESGHGGPLSCVGFLRGASAPRGGNPKFDFNADCAGSQGESLGNIRYSLFFGSLFFGSRSRIKRTLRGGEAIALTTRLTSSKSEARPRFIKTGFQMTWGVGGVTIGNRDASRASQRAKGLRFCESEGRAEGTSRTPSFLPPAPRAPHPRLDLARRSPSSFLSLPPAEERSGACRCFECTSGEPRRGGRVRGEVESRMPFG